MTPCVTANVPKGGRYPRKRHKGRQVQLSRLVYCEHNGVTLDSIAGLVVRHKCDNPACINPRHLEIGTQLDNARDRDTRGRGKTPPNQGEDNPHARLTAEQVAYIRAAYIPRSPEFGRNALADSIGISRGQVTAILKGRAWRTKSG